MGMMGLLALEREAIQVDVAMSRLSLQLLHTSQLLALLRVDQMEVKRCLALVTPVEPSQVVVGSVPTLTSQIGRRVQLQISCPRILRLLRVTTQLDVVILMWPWLVSTMK